MKVDFDWLVAPFKLDDFVQQYWGKKPLRLERKDTEYYAHLLPGDEMEFALYAASKIQDAVEILSEDDRPARCQSHFHAIESFRHGMSLRIDAIQRFSYPITSLCRGLEQMIGCPISVNMYLTSGAGKKALDRHYDTHDVFVLQVHGNKIWRLYDSPVFEPLEYLPLQRNETTKGMKHFRLQNSRSGRDDCKLVHEFILKAGDILYLPKGFWREAESEPGEVSAI